MTTAEVRKSAILTPEDLGDPFFKVRRALGDTAARIYEVIGFIPHDPQLAILVHPANIKLVTGGIQGGKTQLASPIFILNYYLDLVKNPPYEREEREYWVIGHRFEDCAYEWSALRELSLIHISEPTRPY